VATTTAVAFPVAAAPPATSTANATVEASPETRSAHAAADPAAPRRTNWRRVYPVATSGPASGSDTDRAFDATVTARTDRNGTRRPPRRSSRWWFTAGAAMDVNSAASSAGNHHQCRCCNVDSDPTRLEWNATSGTSSPTPATTGIH